MYEKKHPFLLHKLKWNNENLISKVQRVKLKTESYRNEIIIETEHVLSLL